MESHLLCTSINPSVVFLKSAHKELFKKLIKSHFWNDEDLEQDAVSCLPPLLTDVVSP